MPKVKRITSLSREARRRVTTDQVLPSPSTRKSNTTKQDVNVVVDATTAAIRSTDINKDKTKTNNSDETNVNVKKNTTTSTTAAKNKNEDDNDNDEPGTKASQPSLSRGQRKRQAKHEKFLKKEKMILSSLMLKKQDEQKKRIDGLDAIKQALMDTTTTADKKKQYDSTNNSNNNNNELEIHHVSSNKAKRKLVGGEVENMSLILQHPAYKKDPFETLQEHLLNSYKEDKTTQEKLSKQRTQKEKQKKDAKLRQKKEDVVKKKTQRKKYKPRRNK
jgi:hypothetical protein